MLALALVSTAFAYIIYFRLVGTVGATNASLVTLVVPAFAVLLGAAFLAERLEPFELGGMLLIGIGLAVIDGRILSRFGTWGPGRKRLSEKKKSPSIAKRKQELTVTKWSDLPQSCRIAAHFSLACCTNAPRF